jgi:hypothetical protein
MPDICVYTFGSRIHRRSPENFVSPRQLENYLAKNPHNEPWFYRPIEDREWQDPECSEFVIDAGADVVVRGRPVKLPDRGDYRARGIELADPDRVHTFELCRYLAAVARNEVLATDDEQRVCVSPEMTRLLQLDEWNHPNVVDDAARPSRSPTFQQLARVLVTGDISEYRPTEPPNTHWRNWPEGGTL